MGRIVPEADALQAKHEPEFRVLVPSIAEALEQAVIIQSFSLSDSAQTIPVGAPTAEANSSPMDGGVQTCDSVAELAETQLPGEPSAPFAPADAKTPPPPPALQRPPQRWSTIYNSVVPPPVKLITYIRRVADFTYISPAILVAAVILIDRMQETHTEFLLTELNIHKLFLVAVRVASKTIDLKALNNGNFAKVGGVSNEHLNDLECAFLMDLGFNVFVSAKQFFSCVVKFSWPAQAVLRKKVSGGSLITAVENQAVLQKKTSSSSLGVSSGTSGLQKKPSNPSLRTAGVSFS
jgi:hypothetical protein